MFSELPDDFYIVSSNNVTDKLVRKIGNSIFYITSSGELEIFPCDIVTKYESLTEIKVKANVIEWVEKGYGLMMMNLKKKN